MTDDSLSKTLQKLHHGSSSCSHTLAVLACLYQELTNHGARKIVLNLLKSSGPCFGSDPAVGAQLIQEEVEVVSPEGTVHSKGQGTDRTFKGRAASTQEATHVHPCSVNGQGRCLSSIDAFSKSNSVKQMRNFTTSEMSASSCSTSSLQANSRQNTALSHHFFGRPQSTPQSRRVARRERKALRMACAGGFGPDVVHFVQHWSQVLAKASPAPIKPALSVLTADIASTIALHPTAMGLARLTVRAS